MVVGKVFGTVIAEVEVGKIALGVFIGYLPCNALVLLADRVFIVCAYILCLYPLVLRKTGSSTKVVLFVEGAVPT